MKFQISKHKIIILCGGRGKRMGRLTNSIPKPLIKLEKCRLLSTK